MAIIQSGASTDLWTINPVSKAGRVELVDPFGVAIRSSVPAGSYILPIDVRQTSALGAGAPVWGFQAGGVRTVSIRRIRATVCFDGTATPTITLRYQFVRLSVVTALSGGTPFTPAKKRTIYANSSIVNAQSLNAGITATGTFDASGCITLAVPASLTGGSNPIDMPFANGDEGYGAFEIAPNEGFVLRIHPNQPAIIGLGVYGSIEVDER